VGGSEQQCIPQGCGPHCGGGATSIPPPATWYAVGGHEGLHTTTLRGAEFYNNMDAPNNCIGGSETSCPASNLSPPPPPPPDSWYANAGHTQSLGAGPEVYNNMEAPNNCVGGSEGQCIPDNCGWQCGGEAVKTHTTALGVGPEVSNNLSAPHNCVGGSEQQCIPQGCGPHCGGGATSIPPPATWYAVGGHEGLHTTTLRGAEFYNNMDAPNNCIGGSETSCPASNLSPPPPPPPDSWYANAQHPSMQLAPAAAAADLPAQGREAQTVKGQPGHFLLMGHAMVLAAAQGLAKLDFSGFSEDAAANAESCSGLSGFILRNHVVPAAQ